MPTELDDANYLEICIDCYEVMNGMLVERNLPKRNIHKKAEAYTSSTCKTVNSHVDKSKNYIVSSCDSSPVLTMTPVTCRVLRTAFQNYSTPLRSSNSSNECIHNLSQQHPLNSAKSLKTDGFNRDYLKLSVESLYKSTPIRN
jgi:hypothetical protein